MTKTVSAATILTGLHTGNAVDSKKLAALIGTITKSNIAAQIHAAAVATIYRSLPQSEGGHLDCSFAAKLMNALPKGTRAKALAAWFAAYSNIRCVADDKTGIYSAKLVSPSSKMYVEARPADALATPFWTVAEKSVDPAAFDMGKAIAALIKRADKAGYAGTEVATLRKLVPAS